MSEKKQKRSMGLLPDKVIDSETEHEKPWTDKTLDRFLDDYFDGASLGRLKRQHKRTKESIASKIKELRLNTHGCAEKYEPVRRKDRSGERWTEREDRLVKHWREVGMLEKIPDALANILARDTKDVLRHAGGRSGKLGGPSPSATWFRDSGVLTDFPGDWDKILAFRFHYYLRRREGEEPLITDAQYDSLVKEAKELAPGGVPMLEVVQTIVKIQDYPAGTRDLALYFEEKRKTLRRKG